MSLFRRMRIRIKSKLNSDRKERLGKCFKCPLMYSKNMVHYPEGYCLKYASGWYKGISGDCERTSP